MRTATPALVLLLSAVPGLCHAASTLQTSALAGDTVNAVATCLSGQHVSGGTDLRFCDASQLNPAATAASLADSDVSVSFVDGITTSAHAWATMGTLHAVAETLIPVSDGFHNTQSRADASMQDTLIAGSSLGSLLVNYQYTLAISGSKTANQPAWPVVDAAAVVGFQISGANCPGCTVAQTWTASDTVTSGLITGMLTNVPVGTVLNLSMYLHVDSGVNALSAGAGGFAQADYGNTVHLFLDAVTPGATTVGASGHDYASAVPEPGSALLMLAGGLALAVRRLRRD